MIKKIICSILAVLIFIFGVYMSIGTTIVHSEEGWPEASISAWNDICDWTGKLFGIKTNHADVVIPMANVNVEWVNTRISW